MSDTLLTKEKEVKIEEKPVVALPATKVVLLVHKRNWKKRGTLVTYEGAYGSLPLDFVLDKNARKVEVLLSDWENKFKFK